MTLSHKLMLMVTWNHSGFHVVTALPKGLKFNTGYYTYIYDRNTRKNENWWKEQRAGSIRKMIVHADNARPQTAKLSMDFMNANRMTRVLHPPSSPDLAPFDFFRFGDLKRQCSGCSFHHPDDLLTVFMRFLAVLTNVCQSSF
jgi:histone-lysine N-methyltransferase SETMAR